MILSMTGYGRASGIYLNKKISVEVKSLNGKATDLRLKVPLDYKEKEMELRRMILNKAIRGKLEAIISVEDELGNIDVGLNRKLFKKYYVELTHLMDELDIQTQDVVASILRIPNVLQADENSVEEAEWDKFKVILHESLDALEAFRLTEGMALKKDLEDGINSIVDLLDQVEPFEKERIDSLKAKLTKNIEEGFSHGKFDQNRFEQEILYYLEKLDINEEKVRLRQHCVYFLEHLNDEEKEIGRKLSFIAQELGREINTMGAKAQFSSIQRIVVQMKDELEKIKEQLANIV
jgi:uncharacterized protein (TIGR00255 family)